MKKTISLMLCLLLIFSSVNFVFADFTTTDQNNLQSIKNSVNSGGAMYSLLNTIASRLVYSSKGAANWLSDISNQLNNLLQIDDADVGRRSVTYWVREAVLDLDTLTGTGQNTIYYNLQEILNQLTYFSDGGARQSYLSYFKFFFDNALTNALNSLMTRVGTIMLHTDSINDYASYLPGIYAYSGNIDTTTSTYLPILDPLQQALTNYKNGDNWSDVTATSVRSFAHRQLITDLATGEYNHMNITSNGGTNTGTRKWGLGTPLGNIALILEGLNSNFVNSYQFENGGFNSQQTATSWLTLNNSQFNPSSAINGVYTWLSNIQEPIARLSYVHASDEEIEARELAADNQSAVVDNFIDPNGSGAASSSDIADIADLSSGYSQTFSTDASATGIFNIFNSDHMGWFSQETKNQLDTTSNNRKSNIVDTPLLDKQIEDIYNSLGVKQP